MLSTLAHKNFPTTVPDILIFDNAVYFESDAGCIVHDDLLSRLGTGVNATTRSP